MAEEMLCKSDSQWLKRGEAGNESTPVINKCRRTICRKQMRDDGSIFHKVWGGQGGQIVPDIGCQAFGLNIGRIDNRFSGEFSAIICFVSSSLPAHLSFASSTPHLRLSYAIPSLPVRYFSLFLEEKHGDGRFRTWRIGGAMYALSCSQSGSVNAQS